MKIFCRAADPQTSKTVSLLRQYEKTAMDKYLNAKKQNARARHNDPKHLFVRQILGKHVVFIAMASYHY